MTKNTIKKVLEEIRQEIQNEQEAGKWIEIEEVLEMLEEKLNL